MEGLPHRIASPDEIGGRLRGGQRAGVGPHGSGIVAAEPSAVHVPDEHSDRGRLDARGWPPDRLDGATPLPFVATAGPRRARRLLLRPPPPERGTAASTSAWACRPWMPRHEPSSSKSRWWGSPVRGSRPNAVILASDGAWEPFVYLYGADWLSDDSATGGVGAICGPSAETSRRHSQQNPGRGRPPRPRRQRHDRGRSLALTPGVRPRTTITAPCAAVASEASERGAKRTLTPASDCTVGCPTFNEQTFVTGVGSAGRV